ncbi:MULTISPECIES: nucleotidyltransferase family protein [unclassified Nitratiruptor]|uniref:nucleotidyltransferase family protein n=1 Tax=unclassified Nitratiruptor TaxID=2624044 RepID=UPI001914F97D|nr:MULTISPECIES: nucleotidyltransferase domain-containing protein [unclassified Nitratiruptor]BCD60579.1 hypothetical protein NitYY0810_C1350 [Nitratiruptor sp. YY08-10]BCD64510.1 hypothetical protein NitYY0814_C1357 [Nitratiruptor sp. YY08-14]
MRLKPEEIAAIKEAIHAFDPDAKIYLFGSRTDDTKKGGDIDLLIESTVIDFAHIIKIKTNLFLSLGDRTVDIVLKKDTPFVHHIQKEAIKL